MAKAKQPRGLSVKQRRFVEAYNGNATEAALAAGYSPKTARSMAQRLLTNADISNAIQARENVRLAPLIANRDERMRKLTSIMRDEDETTPNKLKAIEILCKANGDFLDRHEVTGKDGAPLLPETVNFTYRLVRPDPRDDD